MAGKSSKPNDVYRTQFANDFDNVYNPTESKLFENRKEWLDSAEAAAYLRVSLGALRNMTCNGHIPYHKLGKRNRYRLEDLRNLLLSQKRGGFRGN